MPEETRNLKLFVIFSQKDNIYESQLMVIMLKILLQSLFLIVYVEIFWDIEIY